MVTSTRIPEPISQWLRDGWMSHHAPTADDIQSSADAGRHARLIGFTFAGPGWYSQHRVLITEVGFSNNAHRYELRFYSKDPRPDFLALAQMVDR